MKKTITSHRQDDLLDKRLTNTLEQWVLQGKHREYYASMNHIADDLNVSKEQLTFFFSTKVGKKFYAWRKSLRIEEAKILLANRFDLSITRIGSMVGIPDKSDFRRQFFEETGHFPYQWREMARKKAQNE